MQNHKLVHRTGALSNCPRSWNLSTSQIPQPAITTHAIII